MSAKYAVVAAHRGQYPVRWMCAVLGVSASGFYAAQQRPPSARRQGDVALAAQVVATFRTSQRRYGAPRIQRALRAAGVPVAQKRVARLMREHGLRARPRRRRRVPAGDPALAPVPNHLARQFTVAAPNVVWVADTTYVPTAEGWLYLAVVLDLFGREVVGWAASATNDEALVTQALTLALTRRQPPAGLLHHSDRGSPYASARYRAVLARAGCTPSMSRVGDCWDNAVAESFFATLEHELLTQQHFPTRYAALRATMAYLTWYNQARLHSSLGYLSPVEYRRRYAA